MTRRKRLIESTCDLKKEPFEICVNTLRLFQTDHFNEEKKKVLRRFFCRFLVLMRNSAPFLATNIKQPPEHFFFFLPFVGFVNV